jgi:hypothetical protein
LKTAAIVLYVIQALAIICAIITGREFIDFSSGPALFETIGFFFPAILALIFDMVAHNKEQKAEQSSTEGSKADSAASSASSAPKTKAASAPQEAPKKNSETTAPAAKEQPVIDPSVQYCPKCGTRQDSENAFCIACGSKIGQ